jgi:hypothetical protein
VRGVTANVLDPGMVKSEFGEQFEGPALIGFMMSRLVPLFAAVDPRQASEQYVRLATDPALANVFRHVFCLLAGRSRRRARRLHWTRFCRSATEPAVRPHGGGSRGMGRAEPPGVVRAKLTP